MTDSKKNVLDSLNHKQPDRLPIDFGGTACSGLHISNIANLRKYYGLEEHPVKLVEPYQCLGEIEDDLKEAMGVDVEQAGGVGNWFGIENKDWVPWKAPWGQDILIPEQFHLTETDTDVYAYPQGDTSVPASGHMPKAGFFFDAIVRQEELPDDDDDLKLEDNLEEFQPLTDHELDVIVKNVETAYNTGRAVLGSFGGTGLGDIALVPAMQLKHPKGIRDITEWYISTVSRTDFLKEIFEAQIDIALDNLRRINERCGDKIDAIFICGTDFGTQNGTFCSVEQFEDLYAPFYKKTCGWVHDNTNWKTFKHCCGSAISFIPSFIECGFDILNPVQCSAKGMDPKVLKDQFGKDITFWGGGVDTQMVLPFGKPEEVRKQVLERCEIFGKDGGYIFNSIHNVQAKTPVENIVAMLDAVKEYNGLK